MIENNIADNMYWSTPALRETPFWKEGMTPEEYEKERTYYYHHIADVKNGTYKPLWRQN